MAAEGRAAAPAVAIILAAGTSSRMAGGDKVFMPLGGRPLAYYSLRLFEDCPEVADVIVVTGDEDRFRRLAEEYSFRKVRAYVAGGPRRQDSAAAGVASAGAFARAGGAILIHDAARPLADGELVGRLLGALGDADGVVPVVPVGDTIKVVGEDGGVVETPPRRRLRAAQTPQAFKAAAVRAAYDAAAAGGWDVTDDAAAVELAGGRVVTVEGARDNIKVTYPEDFARAEQILGRRAARPRA